MAPNKKKGKSGRSSECCLSEIYATQDFKSCIRDSVKNKKCHENDNRDSHQILVDPFTCCILPNFIQSDDFLHGLKDELESLSMNEKSNDLYKFHQSDALQNVTSPYITRLRKFLFEDFLCWLRDVTEIPFSSKVDITCSEYTYTDVLLCHDDELEGRRVAFILYLVPPWTEKDGGCLDLFETDENTRPTKVIKSLVPRWNSFVFFEVTPVSFHQVSEILSESKRRLSVSGWFHGPLVPRPRPHIEEAPSLEGHKEVDEDIFCNWLNNSYLDLLNQSEIQDGFSSESEIQLPEFLNKEKYATICKVLKGKDIRWIRRGPPNRSGVTCVQVAMEILRQLPPIASQI